MRQCCQGEYGNLSLLHSIRMLKLVHELVWQPKSTVSATTSLLCTQMVLELTIQGVGSAGG